MAGNKQLDMDELFKKMDSADGFCAFVCYNRKGKLDWDFITKNWTKADLPWAAKSFREIAVREMESL